MKLRQWAGGNNLVLAISPSEACFRFSGAARKWLGKRLPGHTELLAGAGETWSDRSGSGNAENFR